MSHGGLLGTSRPCHYQVLIDENKMSPDIVQQLTYNLAYIYPRSTRSVSIVSPAYFAHHVATRARAHIGGDIDDDQSVIFSELSSGREAAIRDQKLDSARERLRSIHPNLENSMYFMVSQIASYSPSQCLPKLMYSKRASEEGKMCKGSETNGGLLHQVCKIRCGKPEKGQDG